MNDKQIKVNLFAKATKYVEVHHENFANEKLLDLYALYKQATIGPCNIPQPSWYEFEAKKKWSAWTKIGSEIKLDNAKVLYVETLTSISPDWLQNYDKTCKHNFTCSGVSKFICPEEVSNGIKNEFDWVKEENIDELKNMTFDPNASDNDGMTLLHWAADRGFLAGVEYLLGKNADINALDKDGQTPLHYAASCGHTDVIKYLVELGANLEIKDGEGLLPFEVCEEPSIVNLLIPKK